MLIIALSPRRAILAGFAPAFSETDVECLSFSILPASGHKATLTSPFGRARARPTGAPKKTRESRQPECGERVVVVGGRVGREAAEHDARDAAWRVRDVRRHCADRDARGALRREAVDAGRDCGKGDRGEALRAGERQRGAVAGGEEIVLALIAAAPHRADRVDHVARLEPVAAGDLRGAGVAAAERAALGQKLWPGGAMDGAVDAAAAEEGAVRGIDDGRDVERGDVGDAH